MWSIIISAFGYLFRWLFRTSIIKFVVFGALFVVMGVLIAAVEQLLNLGQVGAIGTLLAQLPTDILFYMGVLKLEIGIPVLLAAALARFVIRRLPIVG